MAPSLFFRQSASLSFRQSELNFVTPMKRGWLVRRKAGLSVNQKDHRSNREPIHPLAAL
jgi:hypothetical protein